MDAPYQETDRISPHFAHWIQPLEDGAWVCTTCLPNWREAISGGRRAQDPEDARE